MGYALALVGCFIVFAIGVIIHDKLVERAEKKS
jgi:hypothetical protein